MAIPREAFLQRLYYLFSRNRVCERCGDWKAVKDLSEYCDHCGKTHWRELTFEDFAYAMDMVFSHEYGGRTSEHVILASQIGRNESSRDARMNIVECLEGFSDEQTARWLADIIKTDHESLACFFDEHNSVGGDNSRSPGRWKAAGPFWELYTDFFSRLVAHFSATIITPFALNR